MKRQLLISCVALAVLSGCGREEHRALQAELDDMTKSLRGKIEPLPVVKPYEAVPYSAFELPDPFGPEKIALAIRGKGTGGPDQTRAREPLEAYSLETLKMVGTLQQHNRTYALVKADSALYKVQVGNYMGQSYGMVTQISETEIALKEWVQDAAGDWSERDSALMLQDAEGSR
jgi:type IV pilus assembly protein PilP